MFQRPIFALCVLILLTGFACAAQANAAQLNGGGRFALVIGNSAYKDKPLKNPANDARDMARTLESLGFTVQLKTDATQRDMEDAIREFGTRLKRGGVGLFYYAGHGVQVQGSNYLVPIGARIGSESDTKFECVDAGRVLGKMEEAGNELNLVILDACRNNPFARSFRSVDVGLARMDAPTGSMVAYSTAPNSVASDGGGRNGLYTKYLLANITTPGIPIEEVFKRVRIGVMSETGKKQVPWESSSIAGYYFIAGGSPQGMAQTRPQQMNPQASAEQLRQEQQLKQYIAGLEAEKRQVEQERAELARRSQELDAEAANKLKAAQAPQEKRLNEQLAILEKERRKLEQERLALEQTRKATEKAALQLAATQKAASQQVMASKTTSPPAQPVAPAAPAIGATQPAMDRTSLMQRLAGVWRIETSTGWRFPLLVLKPGGDTLYGSLQGDERMLERVELEGLAVEDGELHVRMYLHAPQSRGLDSPRTRWRKARPERDRGYTVHTRTVECVGDLRGLSNGSLPVVCGRVDEGGTGREIRRQETGRLVRTQQW